MQADIWRKRVLPEFDSVRRVVESATVEEWLRSTCCNHPDVLQYKDDIDISSFLEGEGKPVCVRGAVTDWNNHWNGLNSLKRLGGASQVVRANDRAPARHADALSGDGQKQQTIYLPFYAYLEYLATFSERTIEESALQHPDHTPFYLNGWTAFEHEPKLLKEFPQPEFMRKIDNTGEILEILESKLFGAGSKREALSNTLERKLTKLFIGPPGCITRLHYDAGDAHGWLGQISGRKLFILFPPKSSRALNPLETEKETIQSALDPFRTSEADLKKLNGMAVILEPGDLIVIPKGWWHYAVSLTCSTTFQRNFYDAKNAASLVTTIMKSLIGMKK